LSGALVERDFDIMERKEIHHCSVVVASFAQYRHHRQSHHAKVVFIVVKGDLASRATNTYTLISAHLGLRRSSLRRKSKILFLRSSAVLHGASVTILRTVELLAFYGVSSHLTLFVRGNVIRSE
jgi:hypothetical protein